MARAGSGQPPVHRITAANEPHSDDLDARMGRYLLSMLIRTVCFVLLFVVDGWMRWVFAAGAVFLPYVAVIFANAGGTRRSRLPPTAVIPRGPRQLEARPITVDTVRVVRADDPGPDRDAPGSDAPGSDAPDLSPDPASAGSPNAAPGPGEDATARLTEDASPGPAAGHPPNG